MSTTIQRYDEESSIMPSTSSFMNNQYGRFQENHSDSTEGNPFDGIKNTVITEEEDENEKKSSMPYASFNFINSIIGSGVIGIPYALHESGFGFGIMLLLLVAYVTDYSLLLMIRSGHLSGQFTYQGIMESAFGKPGHIILGIVQFIYPFIAMVSYNVVVGDTVTKIVMRLFGLDNHSFLADRNVVVLLCTLFITLPLCLYRNIAKLAKISFLSLLCLAFILFSLFFRMGTMRNKIPDSEDDFDFINPDVIPAIGVMSFAFMCHHNTFLIYTSIKETSEEKWKVVTHASIFTSLVVTILFGIVGYATFTSYTQGDLLENYCRNDDLMNVSRLLFSVTILLTYPIECFVVRDVIQYSFLRASSPGEISKTTHYVITITIIIITYFLSMTTDCLGIVLELNGLLAAIPLAYILPAMCYLKLDDNPLLSRKKIPAVCMALFGIITTVLGFIFVVTDFKQVQSCSHEEKVIAYCLADNKNLINGSDISTSRNNNQSTIWHMFVSLPTHNHTSVIHKHIVGHFSKLDKTN